MSQIQEQIFVCLDCESTGLDPEQDRIVEIAGARFNFEKVLQQMESLINPECDIPQTSQEIHKISKEMILDKPKIKEFLPSFLKMIDGHILVGHGIGFDIALIAAEAKRNQIPCKIHEVPFIDTLRLARLYGESPINSLDKLRQHFNIEEQGVHRAMSDVMVNIGVFKYLVKSFKTTEMIFQALAKPIKANTKGGASKKSPSSIFSGRKERTSIRIFSTRSDWSCGIEKEGAASDNQPIPSPICDPL
jgi:DNA polymerase-3 subunit epsilon